MRHLNLMAHVHAHTDRTPLRRVIFFTALFMVIEFVAGWMASSLALMSDAVHMLSDVGALLLSYVVLWISAKPGSMRKTYGLARAEVLGAFVSGILVWTLVGGILVHAIERLSDPHPVNGPLVIVVGLIGLIINIIGMKILHPVSDSNLSLKAAYVHLFGDMLGSVGAVISGIFISLWGVYWLDSVVSFFIAAIIFVSGWRLIRDSVAVLMEFVPKGVDPEKLVEDLKALSGVEDLHDLHIWSVSSRSAALSVHIISKHPEKTLKEAQALVRDKHSIRHSTIQVECREHFDPSYCFDCSTP